MGLPSCSLSPVLGLRWSSCCTCCSMCCARGCPIWILPFSRNCRPPMESLVGDDRSYCGDGASRRGRLSCRGAIGSLHRGLPLRGWTRELRGFHPLPGGGTHRRANDHLWPVCLGLDCHSCPYLLRFGWWRGARHHHDPHRRQYLGRCAALGSS